MIAAMMYRLCVQIKGAHGLTEYIVPEEIFQELVGAAVESIKVDEKWYLEKYDDISEAVAAGNYASATEHYIHFGFNENRQPHKIDVDEEFYLAQNPDVADAIAVGAFGSGQAHFDASGFAEGRMPYPGFSLFRSVK